MLVPISLCPRRVGAVPVVNKLLNCKLPLFWYCERLERGGRLIPGGISILHEDGEKGKEGRCGVQLQNSISFLIRYILS